MTCEVLIQKDKDVIVPKQLLDFFKAAPGDKLNFEVLDNGEVQVKVKKSKSISELLEELHQEMQADNFLEKVGLSTEEDIAEYIRQIRHEKSAS